MERVQGPRASESESGVDSIEASIEASGEGIEGERDWRRCESFCSCKHQRSLKILACAHVLYGNLISYYSIHIIVS